jgi:glycosyltransferase involved in cell wall biosynthesis
MCSVGLNSTLLVLRKNTSIESIKVVEQPWWLAIHPKLASFLDSLLVRLFFRKKVGKTWGSGLVGAFNPKKNKYVKAADVIILYWVDGGFLSNTQLASIMALNKKIIWRLSDMWAFTGGCHYSEGCQKFMRQCGNCEQIRSTTDKDVSYWSLKQKKNWTTENLQIVCPSKWIMNLSKSSPVLAHATHHHIATGVDLAVYKPCELPTIANSVGLGSEKFTILFGAVNSLSDERKGAKELKDAIKVFSSSIENKSDYRIVVFGGSGVFQELWNGIEVNHIGVINSEEHAANVYSFCDVFVAPSREENLANTVIESLACGTPVVAFNVGGMNDLIDHRHNGYLAHPFDAQDLASGISFVRDSVKTNQALSLNARLKALKNFDQDKQITEFIGLVYGR